MIKTIAKYDGRYREIPKVILNIFFRNKNICLKEKNGEVYLVLVKLKYWSCPMDQGIFSRCHPITRELKIKKVPYFWWILFCSVEEDAWLDVKNKKPRNLP